MIEYTVKVDDRNYFWYLNGKRHREDGPAIEFAGGTKEWWLNDLRHRENGPAIEYAGGAKAWYLNGIRYHSEEEYWNQLKPPKELTIAEIESLLGYRIKVVK